MSRVGKNPVELPNGTTAEYNKETRVLVVKGALGKLEFIIVPSVFIEIANDKILVSVADKNDRFERALWGTNRAIIQNMVTGVSKGYEKQVELNGVGYKMELGSELTLYIGFSHPVKVVIPAGIKLTLEKNILKGNGIDKQELGNFFSKIHNMKPADVYKHKGFKFPDRFYRKKVGKKGK